MGNIFIILGIILMILACAGFVIGCLRLREMKQALEEYLYNLYGEGDEDF